MWDVNRDAVVDVIDLVLVAIHLGKTIDQITNPNLDVNGDGVVDITDLVVVARHFEENTNAAPRLARTERGILQGFFDTAPLKQSIATQPKPQQESHFTSPTHFEIDLTQVEKALSALRRQPYFSSRGRAALEALKSWVEAAKQQTHLNSQLPTVTKTRVLPVYPNPFNPEVWIPYELAAPGGIEIDIYAAPGRLVRRLNLGQQPAGRYHRRENAAYWDGRNEAGEVVASGLYVYVMRVANLNGEHNSFVRNMVLLK
jgi:hypothetical protein